MVGVINTVGDRLALSICEVIPSRRGRELQEPELTTQAGTGGKTRVHGNAEFRNRIVRSVPAIDVDERALFRADPESESEIPDDFKANASINAKPEAGESKIKIEI